MQIPFSEIRSFPFFRTRLAAEPSSTAGASVVKVIVVCFLLWGATAQISAQQPISLADANLRGADLFQQSAFTGMVLVVVRNREVMVKTYGETSPGSGRAPAANSLIRLCSISKIFTADLLMKLAAEGKVGLTDPLQNYAPPGRFVPDAADGTKISILDLATHTSGLPREVSAYPRKTPHFTFPDKDVRWNWLPNQKLISVPGKAALYSNIGFDLLGDALASAAHVSYAHLLHDRLIQPLALWDTTLSPSNEQCSRLLLGTRDQGPCTDTQPSGASGGIYSTPTDMVKLLGYLLHVPGSPAQPTNDLAVYRKPQQLTFMQGLSHAGDPTGIGLAWIQIGDPTSPSMLMEKTGGGAGFSTYIALNPKTQTGIFVAATDGKGAGRVGLFHEANNLLAAIANVPPLPPKSHPARSSRKRPAMHRRGRTKRPASHRVQ